VSSRFAHLGLFGPGGRAVERATSTRARPPCERCGAGALDRPLDRVARDPIRAASIHVAGRMVLSDSRRCSARATRFHEASSAELGGSRSELEIRPADDAGQAARTLQPTHVGAGSGELPSDRPTLD